MKRGQKREMRGHNRGRVKSRFWFSVWSWLSVLHMPAANLCVCDLERLPQDIHNLCQLNTERDRERERVAVGVCDSCVVTVSELICSNSQWLLHFTQSTWPSHLHTLPPYGWAGEVQVSGCCCAKKEEVDVVVCETIRKKINSLRSHSWHAY